MTATDVMTRAEAAGRLGVTPVTVRRWVAEGRLTAMRENPLLFDRAEVERVVAQRITELTAELEHLTAEQDKDRAVAS